MGAGAPQQRPSIVGGYAARGQREIPISIDKWAGAYTAYPPDSVPSNGLWNCMNIDYIDQFTLSSRPGILRFIDNLTHGQGNILEGFEYKKAGDSVWNLIYAHSNGNIYKVPYSGGTPTVIGTINAAANFVKMEQLKDKLYIADGYSYQSWDGTTMTTLSLPNSSVPVFVMEMGSRMWALCSDNWLYGSVVNDPDTYTGGNSVSFRIANGDGMTAMSLAKWTQKLLITKGDKKTQRFTLYQLLGTSETDFEIVPVFGDSRSPVGFLGKTAVLVGNDVIGLMPDGFVTASGINNFNEVSMANLSLPIDDVIKGINFEVAATTACAIYDTATSQYLCAVPSEGASSNNLVIVFDVKQARWGFYSGWLPTCLFKIAKTVYFGDTRGEIHKTREGHSDNGQGYEKYIETGGLNGDEPDTIKLFKSIEASVEQNGSYNVDVNWNIDGEVPSGSPVSVTLPSFSSLWNTWVWDTDVWGGVKPFIFRLLTLGRGRSIRVRIYNDKPNQPFTVRRISVRSYATDSGPAKP